VRERQNSYRTSRSLCNKIKGHSDVSIQSQYWKMETRRRLTINISNVLELLVIIPLGSKGNFFPDCLAVLGLESSVQS
jgi:hypothetical protein